MANSEWTRIEELFDDLVDLPEDERVARLANAGITGRVRSEVEDLLRSDRAAPEEFLLPRGVSDPDEWDDVGTAIGPYRLLRRLGEGGFGDVYLAQQAAPLRRRVAVKVLKPGMDSRTVVARFEMERRALAAFDHPNIARVHDAGMTVTGRPYFVMELVNGVALDRWIETRRVDLRGRIALFLQVCRALEHAHRNGIIHRDIKPSNVLVQEAGGRVQVKVIDFGVAKALESSLESRTVLTIDGQLVGTPEYMSPEQARMDGHVDTRTDIYQLGVLLYELLTGRRPFEFSTAESRSLPAILETILQREPPRPSLRARRDQSKILFGIRDSLDRALEADLDWITLKALEKDADRRYAAVSELAADVRRALRHDPVLATPPSVGYRLTRFVLRNRLLVGATVTILIVLATAAGILTWQYVATREALSEKTAALRRLQGARLGAESSLLLDTDPELALLLAIEGAEHAPGVSSGLALLKALEATLDEETRMRVVPRLEGHERGILGGEFSPDGKQIVTTGGDRTARLWDALTGSETACLSLGGKGRLAAAARFSPDGSSVLTVAGRVAQLWDAARGEELHSLEGHRHDLRGAFYMPDGARVVTLSLDRTARIWDARNGAPLARLTGHKGPIMGADSSPEGDRVVTASTDLTARIWDARSGEELRRLEAHRSPLVSARFDPNADSVVTFAHDSTARIWEARSGDEIHVLPHPHSIVRSASFSSDGGRVATASGTRAFVWDVRTGERLLEMRAHNAIVRTVCFTPRGNRVLTGSEDGSARLWDGRSGEELSVLAGHTEVVADARFSPDGLRVLTCSEDGTARIWPVDLLAAAETHRPRLFTPAEIDHYEILPPAERQAYRDQWNPRKPGELRSRWTQIDGRRVVVLTASRFEHNDGSVTHLKTYWQIRSSEGEYSTSPTLDFVTRKDLVSLVVDGGLLPPGPTFYWRLSYTASNGARSEPSAEALIEGTGRGLDLVRVPLEDYFHRDVVSDPGDASNDSFDDESGLFVVDGYDGTSAGKPAVRGLPPDRIVGVHRLGDYRERNSIAITALSRKPIRIELPRGRYTCLRFLVAGANGASTIRGRLEYGDGTSSRLEFGCPDWFDESTTLKYVTAVVNGMDRMYSGLFQPAKDPALFDVLRSVSPEKELVAFILEPAACSLPSRLSQAHLLALTGVLEVTD